MLATNNTSHRRFAGWLLVVLILLSGCDMVDGPSATDRPAGAPTAAPSSPTPLPPGDLLRRGLDQRAVGNYDAAAADFYTLVTSYPAAAEARDADYYLAESFALRRRWTSALSAFRLFLEHEQDSELAARALFWLARCYEEAGAHADAIAMYQRSRALNTPLEPYALMREAAQHQALGQLSAAADAYAAAAAFDVARGERAGSYEKAIALRQQLGQIDQAYALMQQLVALAETPAYRARILTEGAALARTVGDDQQARAWLREIAEQLPETPQALDAVATLLAEPQGNLAPAAAARVYAAHEQFAAALLHYDAAVAAAQGTEQLELRRLRALAVRATGDYDQALNELAAVQAAAPDQEIGLQARLDWVQTRGQRGETDAAIAGYRDYAADHPDDPRAPEALWRAALLLERLGDAEASIQQQVELGLRYPQSTQASSALEGAGWYFYNANRPAEALDAWETLSQHDQDVTGARAAFWGARAAQQAGATQQVNDLLERAIANAPDSYYGARAAELLGREHVGHVPIGAPIDAAQWRAAEEWLAQWAGAPPAADAQGSLAEVARAGPTVRARALAEVGLQIEAIGEWNEARARWHDQPWGLYAVARLAHEHTTPYIALKATEDLLKLAPPTAPAAPEALRRLLFPTPYAEVVTNWSREYNVDPRAVYALLRQESLFNPGATSWVGARGLAQVMPATAEGIAQRLGVTNFDTWNLYQPALSVRFGAFYLSQQLAMMNGSLQGALAAYNGGPGNAQRWANGTVVNDPDLFTEAIDYAETRGYVKLVYGYYGAYQRLYAEG